MWGTLFTFQCQVFWGIVSLATVETRTARPSLAFSRVVGPAWFLCYFS